MRSTLVSWMLTCKVKVVYFFVGNMIGTSLKLAQLQLYLDYRNLYSFRFEVRTKLLWKKMFIYSFWDSEV